MKICAIQMQCTPERDKNRELAVHLISKASAAGADLVVLPEMSILEFFPRLPHRYEFFDLAESIPGPTMEWFAALAKKHNVHIVYNHFERSPEHLSFDTSVVVDRTGKYIGRQRMMHIAEEPGYNERFYYTPGWDRYNVFEMEGWRFGVAICYDRHFPEVFRSLILQGAEFVLVPTAVAAADPFAETYEIEMQAAAMSHGVYIAMANRVGSEPPLEFMGRSMIIDPQGRTIAALDAEETDLANRNADICTVKISKEFLTKSRSLFPFLRDRRPETYNLIAKPPADPA